MKEIEKYRSELSKQTNLDFAQALFNADNIDDYFIELVVVILNEDLNVKEISSYLDFIYRVDGLISRYGYSSYVQNRSVQIAITKIRFGSIEIVIERLLNSTDADKLIIIWLALKYLPTIVNSLTDSVSKVMDVMIKREEYLDKKDRRKFRKQIRELINEEVELMSLDKKGKEKLVNILDEVYMKNRRRLAPASRFAKKFVQSVKLVLKEKNSP